MVHQHCIQKYIDTETNKVMFVCDLCKEEEDEISYENAELDEIPSPLPKRLKMLSLDTNRIQEPNHALMQLQELKTLNLARNSTLRGSVYISSSLRILNLSTCELYDQDVLKMLPDALKLESLDLTDNYLTDAIVPNLVEFLNKNQSIRILGLEGNDDIQDLDVLYKAVKSHCCFESFLFEDDGDENVMQWNQRLKNQTTRESKTLVTLYWKIPADLLRVLKPFIII